jgi:solute carrier family 35 protein F1/2
MDKPTAGMVFGQLLSLILASTNILNSIADGITFPVFQNIIIYPLLFLLITVPNHQYIAKYISALRQKEEEFYLFLITGISMSFADISANYSIVTAFQTTSSLSAMLISSMSTVFVIIFGYSILNIKYQKLNIIGACICLIGLSFILYSKSKAHQGYERETLKGDLYALFAGICYAMSNVLSERLTRTEKGYPYAALSAMGMFGSVFAVFLLFSPLGSEDFKNWNNLDRFEPKYIGLGIYPFLMLAFYILTPKYFQTFSSILFNFHVLTADIYIFIFNYIFKTVEFSVYYWIGVIFVFLGIFMYSLVEPEFRKLISKIEVEYDLISDLE